MNVRRICGKALPGILACLFMCGCGGSEEELWSPSGAVQSEGIYFPADGGTDAFAVVSGNTLQCVASDKILGEVYDRIGNSLQPNHPDAEELRQLWIDDTKSEWAEPREFLIYDIGKAGDKHTSITLHRTYDDRGRIISSSGPYYTGEDTVTCCGIDFKLDDSGRLPCMGSELFTLEAYCKVTQAGHTVTARVGNRSGTALTAAELYGDFYLHGKGEEFGVKQPGYYYENLTFEPGETREFSFDVVNISEAAEEINGRIVIQLSELPEGLDTAEPYQVLDALPVDVGLVV